MKTVREKVIEMMDNTPTLSRLKNKSWYEVEDSITKLICDMFGLTDKTYSKKDEPFDFKKYLEDKEPTEFMQRVKDLVETYYNFEDIQCVINDENNCVKEDKTYSEKDIEIIYKYAHSVLHYYNKFLEYDWRGAMKDAISEVLDMKRQHE